jgi:S-adenosylmethionine:tRNA ribosyltransferase-isomerase
MGPSDAIPRQKYDQLSTYDYDLPKQLIAHEPLSQRDASRLLVVRRATGQIEHRKIIELPSILNRGDTLVLNNSLVLPARLQGYRTKTAGRWEGLFLGTTPEGDWRLMGQTRGRLLPDETITVVPFTPSTELPQFDLQLVFKEADGTWQARPSLAEPLLTLLDRYGAMPLPPYMERDNPTAEDHERYQTTFAKVPGSVAAPTAGLHFTSELLERCQAEGIDRAEVTLHVGIGTFRPVAVEDLSQHVMHAEFCRVSAEASAQLGCTFERGGRIIAIGTTSFRTLETVAKHLEGWPASQCDTEWFGETSLFVRPPYTPKVIGGLLTNFHLPKSTLLMLVSAIAGVELIREAYRQAIIERYRFFSYGDAMLIL